MNVPAPKFMVERLGAVACSAPIGVAPRADRWTCSSRRPGRRSRASAMPSPKMCAEPPPRRAPRSPAGRRRLTRSAPPCCARPRALLEDNQEELIPWIARETGGIPAKAGFEIHMVTEILYRSAGDVHRAARPGAAVRSRPHQHRPAHAARRHRRHFAVQFPADPVDAARWRPRSRPATRSCSSPIRARAMTGGFIIARMFEEAGLPKGVLHVLPAAPKPAKRSARDPDIAMVSFTGSSDVGRASVNSPASI